MSEVLRNIVDRAILEHNAARSQCPRGYLTPEQMADTYNDIYDEFLRVAWANPWLNGDYSEVPDDQVEKVRRLVAAIVLVFMSRY